MKKCLLLLFLLISVFLAKAEIIEIEITSPGSADNKFFEPYENETQFKIKGEMNTADLQNFRLSCYMASYVDLSEANFHAYNDEYYGQSYKDNEFPESLANMKSLETLILPRSTKIIKDFAIYFLDNLRSLTLPGETIPTTDINSIQKKTAKKATLYVPSALLEEYKNQEPFSFFSEILPIQGEKKQKPLISIESISKKGTKSSLCLIGTSTKLQVDYGDGNLQEVSVSNEIPSDINQVKLISFVTPVENGIIKIYGEGIKLLVFSYPNKIKAIHTDNAPNLEVLDLNNTGLTDIDISKNPKMRWLYLFGNMGLTTIDLSNNSLLENIQLQYTGLSNFVLGEKNNLHTLLTFNSTIKSIDASHCPALEKVIAYQSSLEEINVTGCSKLNLLWAGESHLTTVELGNNSSLEDLQIYSNENLTSVDLSSLVGLKKLYIDGTGIETLDLSVAQGIETIDAHRAQLRKVLFSDMSTPKSCILWGNLLDACALDYMFLSLGKTANKGLLILKSGNEGNPGIATSKTSIATKKGYRVIEVMGKNSNDLVGDGSGCPDTIDAIGGITKDSKLVYPTVTTDYIYLSDYQQVANIKVYNLNGELLAEPTPNERIDLSGITSDQVILLIETLDGRYESCRIVIQ